MYGVVEIIILICLLSGQMRMQYFNGALCLFMFCFVFIVALFYHVFTMFVLFACYLLSGKSSCS